MKKYYLNPLHFEKWMHQNKGNYTGMFLECSLLDNFVIETKRGFAFVYEHYVNPNMSDYLVEFIPYKNTKEIDVALSAWYDFYDKYNTGDD